MSTDDRLHEKLDKLDDRLSTIDVHLATYNEQLKYHIDRTDRLEAMVVEQADEIKPLKAHVEQVKGARKLVGIVGTIVSILSAIAGAIMWSLKRGQ